ncbi:alpha glucosidase [Frigidibacter sp. RF13]|uniref:alpha-glucosidase n=1 Tax=Frigidibacter sp. RF13 TaxID=2997340 RepID=UPI0022700F31|nr:alpha-glucosidase [Frigidibacter sp. RF13]MCY1125374.1 alpha glucosidase [Frigidibacter sp. RF13]
MNMMTKTVNRQLPGDADWWRGAVIYQIYPRSFQDTNGDGIGDLAGITRRLDYVAGLGVDAIWISPFFTSPMKDFGYDVSDYRDVDPMFGTLADFDELMARAHELGLRVMIDLVLSHTADVHPWFKESRSSRTNPKADWYVWADPKPDGTVPNNWPSVFGGPAWQWDGKRMQYYLHNFLASQPDLNFHNPDVQEALLDVARFWLERGVDGFRLDTINFYFHDKELRDNPPLPADDRNDSIAPKVNPYNWQEHIYSKNRPENLEFLRKLRALMNRYNAAAVGEVGDAQRGLEIMGQYTSGDDLMQMCYSFDFLAGSRLTAADIAAIFARLEAKAPDAWPCWAYSNHDMPRHISRWNLSDAAAKAYLTLLMCLRGSACIYQGEELGLPEADVAFEDLQDPYGIEFWPEFKGRDGCRTPMVWQRNNGTGGFTSSKPWLPVPSEHLARAVDVAEADTDGLLQHYRKMLAFRHRHPVLAKGDQFRMRANGDVLCFERTHEGQRVFVAVNLGNGEATVDAPDFGNATRGPIELGPWDASILVGE